jgi:AraC-like DNA-binding protein
MNESIRLPGYVLADIAMVKAHIDQFPLQQKNTDYFSDLTGINRKLLQKVFKHCYQHTISEYQLQKRMEVAAKMLQEGRLTQKQIASRCGYHKANNFSRAFKKVFKHSPRSFQYTCYEQLPTMSDIKTA